MDRVRAIVEVTAGIVPGTPEDEFTRRFHITSQEWADANEKPGGQAELLATVNGRAQGYAAFLMLQPDRLNFVRTDWLWL